MEFIVDPYLVLHLPLSELDGKSFMSRDAYGHLGAWVTTIRRDAGSELVKFGNEKRSGLVHAKGDISLSD